MDEQYDIESDDERLVRTALLAAYPPERSKFVVRRGEQIIRAAANERLNRRPSFTGSRVAASVAAAFTLLAGTAGAAGAALPGQPLYPIKRMVERAMVAVTPDDSDAARLELRFAERRLHEAAFVSEEPVASRLAEKFNEHINAANSLAGEEISGDIEQLRQSHDDQTDTTYDRTSVDAPPVDESSPAISSPSPSPSPSASPGSSPDASSPSPSPSPVPSPSPSPSAGTGVGRLLPDIPMSDLPGVNRLLPDRPDQQSSPSDRPSGG